MKHEDPIAETQMDKIQAKLQQAKAKLDGLVATAKERKLQAEIETINALRDKEDEIRARIQEFKAPGDAQASQVTADLGAKVDKFEKEVRRIIQSIERRRADMITKVKGDYQVLSSKDKNLGGPYKT